MTELVERKGQSNAVMGFLVVCFALAAIRGMANAPVLAIIFALLAVGTVAFGIHSALQPATVIRITPFEITWGTKTAVRTRIGREPTSRLRFRRNPRIGSPWLLYSEPGGGGPIGLDGFHPVAVGRACTEQGWEFESTAPFSW